MKRGVLTVAKNEIIELVKYFHLDDYKDTPLFAKLSSILHSDKESMEIEVSEDELEEMLDSIILPIPGESAETKTLRAKLQTLLTDFRGLR